MPAAVIIDPFNLIVSGLGKAFAGKVSSIMHQSTNGTNVSSIVTTYSATPTVDTLIFPIVISQWRGGSATAQLEAYLAIGAGDVFRLDFKGSFMGYPPLATPFGHMCRAGTTWYIRIYATEANQWLLWSLQKVVA